MSQASEPRSEFRFVLNSVRPESLQAVAQELTNLFPLDLPNAQNIAKSAPIILLDKLTPMQARSVGTYALRLRALGADVQVTSQAVGRLQVLRWPLLPEIAKRPGNHVICPSCGARLQMLVHVAPAERAAAPAAEAGAGAPAAEAQPEAPARRTASEEPIDVGQVLQGLKAQPEAAAAPRVAAPAAAPQTSSPSPRPAPRPEPEEVVLEPVGDEEGVEAAAEEEPVLEAGTGAPPAPPLPSAAAQAPRPAPPPTPGQPVGGGGTSRVMLVGRIRGGKKRQAAQLVAYYLGLTEEEALAQLNKTVVTVARDLTPEQAEECRRKFDEVGVKVNIKG